MNRPDSDQSPFALRSFCAGIFRRVGVNFLLGIVALMLAACDARKESPGISAPSSAEQSVGQSAAAAEDQVPEPAPAPAPASNGAPVSPEASVPPSSTNGDSWQLSDDRVASIGGPPLSANGQMHRPPRPAMLPPSTANGRAPELSLPAFPWPPPRYSAFASIAREWVGPGTAPVLGEVAGRLERAFNIAGYGESSYYRIPGGFALASRIEHIREDASPFAAPERWAVDTPRVREGFIDYIRALFNAPPGFYRVIVFVVTDQDFAAGEHAPSSAEAREWVTGGGLRLPEHIAALPYGPRYYTTALIYEFERRGDEPQASVRTPSPAPGQIHLEQAGLWQALAAR